ncbi:MAG: NAD(P)-binding protein, partial [Acidobacteriota bacterium]
MAVGYFARQHGWACRILEGADRVGGNCATEHHGEFHFDRGAHRFHDRDVEITAEVRTLLGDELRKVSAPSAICLDGRFLTFPPSPQQLFRHLGARRFLAAACGALGARVVPRAREETFESFAIRAYGPALARLFLLNYS